MCARGVAAADLDHSGPCLEHGASTETDEAVAAPLLAALVRLEQEGVAAVVDLEEDREGGVEVGYDLADERDGARTRSQLSEALEVRADHGDTAFMAREFLTEPPARQISAGPGAQKYACSR
jgi:hypothetical protein